MLHSSYKWLLAGFLCGALIIFVSDNKKEAEEAVKKAEEAAKEAEEAEKAENARRAEEKKTTTTTTTKPGPTQKPPPAQTRIGTDEFGKPIYEKQLQGNPDGILNGLVTMLGDDYPYMCKCVATHEALSAQGFGKCAFDDKLYCTILPNACSRLQVGMLTLAAAVMASCT
mmetsp:Transcript_6862/g.12584  ORF Transcript_6862/g.12584 Transcript_6862/m.12584 type:complete len:170 (+) Transcript_6862:3-512(+)